MTPAGSNERKEPSHFHSKLRYALMDVMVQWDDAATGATPLARVSAIASRETLEAPSREIVTLYGTPTP